MVGSIGPRNKLIEFVFEKHKQLGYETGSEHKSLCLWFQSAPSITIVPLHQLVWCCRLFWQYTGSTSLNLSTSTPALLGCCCHPSLNICLKFKMMHQEQPTFLAPNVLQGLDGLQRQLYQIASLPVHCLSRILHYYCLMLKIVNCLKTRKRRIKEQTLPNFITDMMESAMHQRRLSCTKPLVFRLPSY